MSASRLARRILPHPDTLAQTKGLKWLGHYLAPRPWLWVAHRRRVALGVAVGLAVGVIPLPTQMVLAAVLAIACRANVAAAIAATWLTNPLTLVPIWSLAIALGRFASGHHGPIATPEMLAIEWQQPGTWAASLWTWVQALGEPLLIGLPLAGLVLGALAYLVVYFGWWAVIKGERWRRLRQRARRS
ncbi:DUF2062 domain-containing protein [Roseateles oligotrophus]|uniref:DUF2062 domain-containing protein n=1 Tax=Roseateles oligotrophus TaxID=1769250 RepID=A0ABT2YJC4_9BURK|nr:DUF2062 domain-containing protein [Roseateles oligotrophus]MCV2370177.1 DUF2062 domain-containing protein [Roseateles oligotrophus]